MAVVQAAREMTEPPPSSDGKASLAILVAADGQATKDLLKLLLTQRGHRVDLVDDGGRALKALLDRRYDIALVDFILPTMDGLRVVAEFKSSPAAVGGSPHFIGITADAAGFMAHPDNWRTFDLVIAKPIDLTNLGTVVENFERYMAWRSQAAGDQGAAESTPVILADDGAETTASPSGLTADRRWPNRRKKIGRGTTQIVLSNGEVHPCRVLDLSLSGAALELEARPAVGERVRVGRTEGRVVRYTDEGIAVEFGVADK
jgi:CheY-like chemotaxis protein